MVALKPVSPRKWRVWTLARLAKSLGYASASDYSFRRLSRLWLARGLLEVQQGGYRGDSMHHPKLAKFDVSLLERRGRVWANSPIESSEGASDGDIQHRKVHGRVLDGAYATMDPGEGGALQEQARVQRFSKTAPRWMIQTGVPGWEELPRDMPLAEMRREARRRIEAYDRTERVNSRLGPKAGHDGAGLLPGLHDGED